MFSPLDHKLMARAVELAARGRYTTSPNPRVGCVVARNEQIVGEGWHRKKGEPHAEPLALAQAADQARGATVYVTLEPHCFQSRTPPCTDVLIRAGVARVVCAMVDPHPRVAGAGIRQLRAAGIAVDIGLLESSAAALNPGFIKRHVRGLPRITVKVAASLDGRTALANGASQWITAAAARADVQRLRAASCAIVTGVDSIISDDPRLTVRDPALDTLGRQPLRVILDSRLRLPATAQLLRQEGRTLVIHTQDRDTSALANCGTELWQAPAEEGGRVCIEAALQELAQRECNEVLVEAGSTLTGRILASGLADELIVYMAPMLLGGDARPLATLPALTSLSQARKYQFTDVLQIGSDLRLTLSAG